MVVTINLYFNRLYTNIDKTTRFVVSYFLFSFSSFFHYLHRMEARRCKHKMVVKGTTHTSTHTLFKNTQQTCMNKMQMTITKEKKITTYT